ncbi:MAG: hypothetical protein LBV68_00045 [Spirochaetaceae bacterium]|nr:hypothetical protein [Spirochaetaceae bacterium]
MLLVYLCTCQKKEEWSDRRPVQSEGTPLSRKNPDFLIELSSVPLWLELRNGGLEQINSPSDSNLNDFEPWPLMPHITGIIPLEDAFALAVNRIGFFLLYPWEDGEGPEKRLFAVKKIAGKAEEADSAALFDLGNMSASAPFLFNGNPTVILFNVDYFSDSPLEKLTYRAYSLFTGSDRLQGVTIPAFSAFPLSGGWEIKNFFINEQGACYFSPKKTDGNHSVLRYYRAESLLSAENTREIPLDVFRKAEAGGTFGQAPVLVKELLEKLSEGTHDKTVIARIYCDTVGASVLWTNGGGDESEEVSGFYREKPYAFSAAVRSDGIFSVCDKNGILTKTLPPLPPDFVYTSIAIGQDILVASWEERQSWNIGASGLVVLQY